MAWMFFMRFLRRGRAPEPLRRKARRCAPRWAPSWSASSSFSTERFWGPAPTKETHEEHPGHDAEGASPSDQDDGASSRAQDARDDRVFRAGQGEGHHERRADVIAISIDPEVVNPEEADLLEDLVLAAFNDARSKITRMVEEE